MGVKNRNVMLNTLETIEDCWGNCSEVAEQEGWKLDNIEWAGCNNSYSSPGKCYGCYCHDKCEAFYENDMLWTESLDTYTADEREAPTTVCEQGLVYQVTNCDLDPDGTTQIRTYGFCPMPVGGARVSEGPEPSSVCVEPPPSSSARVVDVCKGPFEVSTNVTLDVGAIFPGTVYFVDRCNEPTNTLQRDFHTSSEECLAAVAKGYTDPIAPGFGYDWVRGKGRIRSFEYEKLLEC